MTRITALWVTGLVTAVPYGAYYLFFEASRDEYAFLITFILFWVFGFWALVGPVVSAIKVRNVLRALETARSKEQLQDIIRSNESKEALIEFIATENKIPRFIARKIYPEVINRIAE